jgi:hypothetical protein
MARKLSKAMQKWQDEFRATDCFKEGIKRLREEAEELKKTDVLFAADCILRNRPDLDKRK